MEERLNNLDKQTTAFGHVSKQVSWLLLLSLALAGLPSVAEAQLGWPSKWNPWSGGAEEGQTPTDPFAKRRTNPEFRTAARTTREPLPPTYPTANSASAYQAAATAPGYQPTYPSGGQAAPVQVMPTGNYGQQPSAPVTASISDLPQATYSRAGGPSVSDRGSNYSNFTPRAEAPPRYSPTNQFNPNPTTSAPAPNDPQYGAYPATDSPTPFSQPQTPAQFTATAKPQVESDSLFEPARIVAIVNGEPILAGDVLGTVNQLLEERLKNATPEQYASVTEEEKDQFREMALKQMLPGLIDVKVVYLDFMRAIPADRREDMQVALDKNYDEYQLEADMKEAGVNTRAELDLKLRETGSSLAKKRRQFVQRLVTQQQIAQKVKSKEEVTHLEMLDYYNEHAQDYELKARAKWEQLMVRFDEFPSRNEAWAAMAELGNQVLRGAPLDAVAKRGSQGFRADQGGQYDWTSRGSLRNEVIDEVIFTLPIGELSPILESDEGYHIVRVIDRDDAGSVPFTEAQGAIKEKIQKERRQKQIQDYLDKVKSEAQVWTVFDDA